MFTFGLLGDSVCFVVGLVWCSAMFRRWRSDLDELRTSKESGDRVVIAVLWVITAYILVCMTGTSVGVLRSLGRA